MAYMTKPGSGAKTLAPGRSQAKANKAINSSEPLPSISEQPAGKSTLRAKAFLRSLTRPPG